MTTNDHIEELLPRYAEEDLTADEKRAVDEHLSSCADCSEALELYTSLEKALISFKRERPSSGKTYAAVSRRLPLDPAFSPVSLLRSPVLLGTAAVTLIAVLTILFHEKMGITLARLGGVPFDSLSSSFQAIPEWIISITGGNLLLLVLIVTVETLLFSFAMGFAALRIIRH